MTASIDATKTKIGIEGAPTLKKAPPANASDISPKRFGLKFNPPQIVLEYVEVSTGKLFHRVMGLSKLKKGQIDFFDECHLKCNAINNNNNDYTNTY